MAPGTRGDDVRQLQAVLTRLGFNPGPATGEYNGATAAAVATWYRQAGYAAQGPTEEQATALRALQTEQYTANTDLLAARDALQTAQNNLAAAQDKLKAAQAASDLAASAANAAQARASRALDR